MHCHSQAETQISTGACALKNVCGARVEVRLSARRARALARDAHIVHVNVDHETKLHHPCLRHRSACPESTMQDDMRSQERVLWHGTVWRALAQRHAWTSTAHQCSIGSSRRGEVSDSCRCRAQHRHVADHVVAEKLPNTEAYGGTPPAGVKPMPNRRTSRARARRVRGTLLRYQRTG